MTQLFWPLERCKVKPAGRQKFRNVVWPNTFNAVQNIYFAIFCKARDVLTLSRLQKTTQVTDVTAEV